MGILKWFPMRMTRKPDSAITLHNVLITGIEQRRIVDDAKEKVGIEKLKGGCHRKTDGRVRYFSGGDREAAGGYHLCGFEGAEQNGEK